MPNTVYDLRTQTIQPVRPVTPADPIPWADRSVTLFWFDDGVLQQTTSIVDKRELVQSTKELYAAWTGKWKTDIVQVDRKALKEAVI